MKPLVCVVFLLSTLTFAQTPFEMVGGEPILEQPGNPGAVLFHDGQFHMFHNVFEAFPSETKIHYATSADGLTWTSQSEAALLSAAEVPFETYAILASDVLVEGDGHWVLYFTAWHSTDDFAGTSIGRAVATSPLGPWTVDVTPVLEPSPNPDAWDALQVAAPSVIKTGEGYTMYYTGAKRDNALMIGMATSADGKSWTKLDDPATTEPALAESDPLIEDLGNPAFPIRFQDVWQPRAIHTPDGYIMLFKSGLEYHEQGGAMVRFATSDEGVSWTPNLSIQAITYPETGGDAIWFSELVYHEGIYYAYLEVEKEGSSSIYVATYEGVLEP